VYGVVSYQLPLCEKSPPPGPVEVKSVRLTEAESSEPIAGEFFCTGSQNEPGAMPGHVCLFQAGDPGATEAQWKGAKFVKMEEPDGVASETSGKLGVRAVFQTTGFNEAAKGTIPAGGSYLVAGGTWAVTAP
jgi:hypothetical protein